MEISLAFRYLAFLLLALLATIATTSSRALETLDRASTPMISSFNFERFERNLTSDSDTALYGNARIDDSAVRISSGGGIVYGKPLRFLGTKPGFSSYFSFSISSSDGLGLAFSLSPSSSRSKSYILSVKYATSIASPVEIDAGGEPVTKSSNLSSSNLVLSSGEKFHSWIDYNGESKRVEVRLSESRARRPSSSLISYSIDLSGLLWRDAMYVGISSSPGNSTQTNSVYSWNFTVKHGAPYRMHSEPLDTRLFLVNSREGSPVQLRRAYPWGNLVALIVGAVFGVLAVFTVIFVRSVMFDRSPVAPVEYPELTIESGSEKSVLVGGKHVESVFQ